MARALLTLGLLITLLGALAWLVERAGYSPGRLPGDMVWRGKNTTFYFPLATSLLLSVLLTLGLWFFRRR